ncbi:MAG TPA: 6-carboxytetrahydropterin synthase [Candidatus Methylomirabilis sp.]|nr:6-carboxytetrahydropterin synthase [Candidatus Methylomirabilis sp.]
MRRAEIGLPIVEVTRAFRFSAAHRLDNPRLSPAENARIYGRCNNPGGHGHTYHLEVTIRGPISPDTGWIVGGPTLGAAVRAAVLDRFDRANLDREITPVDGPTSTTEVLAGLIWRLLDANLPAGHLHRLRVEETPNNFFQLDRSDLAPSRGPGEEARPA